MLLHGGLRVYRIKVLVTWDRVEGEAPRSELDPQITPAPLDLGAFDDHHVEVRGPEALLARGLVLHRVVEALRRLDVGKLRHHDALEGDVALERGFRPAAHQESAAVL